jgi:hypothetical protein
LDITIRAAAPPAPGHRAFAAFANAEFCTNFFATSAAAFSMSASL